MASIGGLLGTAGGAGGTGFTGPGGASVINPTNGAQLGQSYTDTQNSMQQQQGLLNALQAQNGLGNQTSVFNQLQGVANGTGPNPAQAALNQNTGANVSNQAALMAGQRGSSANAGLIARQAAQQGAATQQQAVGQGATMQANQSLNALGQLGGIANTQAANQIGQTNANTQSQQAEQNNLIGANAGVNANNVSMQSNVNNVNGQLANTQLQGQQALLGGLMQGAGGAGGMMSGITGMFGGAEGGQITRQGFQHYDDGGEVADDKQPDTSAEAAPAPAAPPQAAPASFSGGQSSAPASEPVGSGATPAFGADSGASALAAGASGGGSSSGGSGGAGLMSLMALMANGGQVQAMAAGGMAQGDSSAFNGASSKFGQFLSNMSVAPVGSGETPNFGADNGAKALHDGAAGPDDDDDDDTPGGGGSTSSGGASPKVGGVANQMMMAQGGHVPALVSPGEKYLSPKAVQAVQKGASPMKVGETIPGKPNVKGAKNSYANDTIPKTLEEGGIVLPRSVTQSKHPHWAAHKFVSDLMAKQGKALPPKPGKK